MMKHTSYFHIHKLEQEMFLLFVFIITAPVLMMKNRTDSSVCMDGDQEKAVVLHVTPLNNIANRQAATVLH